MELVEWTIEYIRARDAVRKSLREHSIEGDVIHCVHDHKKHDFIVNAELSLHETSDWTTMVCLNTPANRRFLLENWEEFLADKLCVIFAAPDDNVHWQVCPKVHAMVSDPKALKKSLDALASDVPNA